jgi:hypothetical protein
MVTKSRAIRIGALCRWISIEGDPIGAPARKPF